MEMWENYKSAEKELREYYQKECERLLKNSASLREDRDKWKYKAGQYKGEVWVQMQLVHELEEKINKYICDINKQ
jgi:conjugal transfer/entry exclusion protein